MKITYEDIVAARGHRFSSKDASEILGIKPERLREWFVRGYVHAFQPPSGPGSRIGFSRGDLYFAAIFNTMIDFGVNREEARKLTQKLGVMSDQQKAQVIAFIAKGPGELPGVAKIEDYETVSKYLEIYSDEYLHYHIINFGKIRKNVDNAISKFLK